MSISDYEFKIALSFDEEVMKKLNKKRSFIIILYVWLANSIYNKLISKFHVEKCTECNLINY